jgi:hypothetical protein
MVLVHFNLTDDDEKIYDNLSEIQKNELFELILKYLLNKNNVFLEDIIDIYKEQKLKHNINFEDGSKSELEILQSCVKNTEKEIRSCHSIDERKELETSRQYYTNQIEFLNDLAKIQKITRNRFEITLTKSGLLEIFFSFIQQMRFIYFSKLLESYLKVWKDNIGDKHSIDLILKEVTNTKFEFFSDDNYATLSTWGYQWVLNQFGYDCDLEFIEKRLEPILEKRELDRFEKELDKPTKSVDKNFNLTDFSKINGYEFEHFIANLFKKKGYRVDITPKSRDQGADLIITDNNDRTVVQVKNYSQVVSNSAIQQVVAAKEFYRANKAMVVTSSFFSPSAIELAFVNNVVLWDCDKLNQILSEERNKNQD